MSIDNDKYEITPLFLQKWSGGKKGISDQSQTPSVLINFKEKQKHGFSDYGLN